MPKTKTTLPAVTAAARQASHVPVACLRDGAAAALADATARVVTKLAESASAGSVRLASLPTGDFVLKHGGNTYQLQDGALAVTTDG